MDYVLALSRLMNKNNILMTFRGDFTDEKLDAINNYNYQGQSDVEGISVFFTYALDSIKDIIEKHSTSENSNDMRLDNESVLFIHKSDHEKSVLKSRA